MVTIILLSASMNLSISRLSFKVRQYSIHLPVSEEYSIYIVSDEYYYTAYGDYIFLIYSVSLSFHVIVAKYVDRNNIKKKVFILFLIPVYNPSLWRNQGNMNSKQLITLHL